MPTLDSSPRVIIRYPNRRLYDTVQHRYVSLRDLRELVVRDVSFMIQDRRSHADMTYATLLHLLGDGEPVLRQEFLLNAIRAQSRPGHADLDLAVPSGVFAEQPLTT